MYGRYCRNWSSTALGGVLDKEFRRSCQVMPGGGSDRTVEAERMRRDQVPAGCRTHIHVGSSHVGSNF